MRRALGWMFLVAVFATATAVLGWWTTPLVAAIWGAVTARTRTWLAAAMAAFASWVVLLLLASLGGPMLEMARILGGIFSLPGLAVILLTLALPAFLAGSAAELASGIRGLAIEWRERNRR